ncbi:cytochrome P450 6B5-like [Pectinophora gossypiella]|uniref:cytochrome P450 6B5-like n=1 Tax=Pectinophora gossypiella TaxID=13191 RepID=UPI00214F42C5|nr:cytochrome P450 6B5-like [Pectinophora gossypiella]
MLLQWSLALTTIVFAVYWFLTERYGYWKKKNVPGPKPQFIFGNTKELALHKKFIGSALKDVYNQCPDEKVVGFYRMIRPCLLLRDLDIVKNIMIKDFDMFMDRGVGLSEDGLGANLFSADGNTWRILRTKFTPLFTSGKLKNMFPLISERANRLFDSLDNVNENPEQDIQLITKLYTLSSIAACAFGLDIDIRSSDDPTVNLLHRMDKLILEGALGIEFFMMIPGILKTLNSLVFPAEITKFFYDLVKTVFTQRNGVPSNRKDFMDLILEMKQQKVIRGNKLVDDEEISVELTDGMIAAQAFVFYVAGFETSSTTLSFLLYELTKNPGIQEKLLEEVDEALKKSGGNITYDVLMDLPYLTQVFDETLRKYPIVDPLQRCAVDDYKIPGTDLTIKKGEIVFVSVSGIHNDEKYYPNPEKFDPERFSAENSRDRHSCAYIPFGTGPRNCIGMRFAKVQSRMFIVKLLSQFRVEASENTPKNIKADPKRVLLGPDQRIILKVIPRHK